MNKVKLSIILFSIFVTCGFWFFFLEPLAENTIKLSNHDSTQTYEVIENSFEFQQKVTETYASKQEEV